MDALRLGELLNQVGGLIEAGGPATVSYVNAHVLNLAARDPALLAFLQQVDLCYCDGNGVRLAARLLGQQLPERMTGADWIWDLAAMAEGRWRLYWLGGAKGVTEQASAALCRRHPRLDVGHDHGFHPAEGPEHAEVLAKIAAFAPDILLVGMGSPRQERWVAAHRSELQVPVVWCLGATADFVAGVVPRPGPPWLVEHAEWLSRLIADPRRLAGRYLLGNAEFLGRILRERHRRP